MARNFIQVTWGPPVHKQNYVTEFRALTLSATEKIFVEFQARSATPDNFVQIKLLKENVLKWECSKIRGGFEIRWAGLLVGKWALYTESAWKIVTRQPM